MTKIQHPSIPHSSVSVTRTTAKSVPKVQSAPQVSSQNNVLNKETIQSIKEIFKRDPVAAAEALNHHIIQSHPLGSKIDSESMKKIKNKVTNMILNDKDAASFLARLLGDESPK